MNFFTRFLMLVCVAFSFGGCSADNMSRLDVTDINAPAYADSDEFEDVDNTEPVVFNTIDGQCHRLDPPNNDWRHDTRQPVWAEVNGRPQRVQQTGTPCVPGMRIVGERAILPPSG